MGNHHFKKLKRSLASIVLLTSWSGQVYALPQIEEVISGAAQIQVDQNTMTIHASENTIVQYSSFNINPHESVIVTLPSSESKILNRVSGNSLSEILGDLTTHGLFILTNPNGIYIGPQARINADRLIISTREIANQDFLNENFLFKKFSEDQLDRLLLNEGTINLQEGGFGALIAGGISNTGTIVVSLGKVVLAAGDTVRLDISGEGLIAVALEEKTASTIYDREGHLIADQIKHSGTIEAKGGVVILSAESLPAVFADTINLDGIVRADCAINAEDGRIDLVASGDIQSTGTISAEGGTIDLKAGGTIVSHGSLIAEALNEYGAAFDIGGIYQVDRAFVENWDGFVNLSTGKYSGTIADPGSIDISKEAVITLIGDTALIADSVGKGVGQLTMNKGSSIVGNGYHLILSSSKNSDLRGIIGVGSLTFNRSSESKNPIYTANNDITSFGSTVISKSVTLRTGAMTLTTNDLSIAGTLNGGDSVIDVKGDLNLLGTGTLEQETITLMIAKGFSLDPQTTFKKATGGKNLILQGTGILTDNHSTKQDLGHLVIGGSGVTRTLGSAVKLTALTINANNVFSLAGNNLQFSSAVAVSNEGTFRLRGNETLTKVTNLDIDSGLVEYTGDGDLSADTFILHDFGSTNFFNLKINTTDSNDVVQLAKATTINGRLSVNSGILSLNGNNLSVADTVAVDTTIRLDGNEKVILSAGNDDDSGTWQYVGTKKYTQLAAGNHYYHLTLSGSGSWIIAADTYIKGDFTIDSNATFSDNGKTIFLAGDWSNSGKFSATGQVIFNGGDQIILGSSVFNNLTKIATGPEVLIFDQGKTQMIKGALTLKGESALTRLSLRSSSAGQAWNLLPLGPITVANLDIKDSHVLSLNDIRCDVGCLDSLGNQHWLFSTEEQIPPQEDPDVKTSVDETNVNQITFDQTSLDQTIGLLPVEEPPPITLDPREFPQPRGKRGRSKERFKKLWVPLTWNTLDTSSGFNAPRVTNETGSPANTPFPFGIALALETSSPQKILSPVFTSAIIAPPEEIFFSETTFPSEMQSTVPAVATSLDKTSK